MKKDTEITFSSEDKEILKKYEQKFKTALEGDYIRGVQKSDSRVLHEMMLEQYFQCQMRLML